MDRMIPGLEHAGSPETLRGVDFDDLEALEELFTGNVTWEFEKHSDGIFSLTYWISDDWADEAVGYICAQRSEESKLAFNVHIFYDDGDLGMYGDQKIAEEIPNLHEAMEVLKLRLKKDVVI